MQATLPSVSQLASFVTERTAAPRTAPPAGVAVDSSALLQGNKAVSISHNGAMYRLQSTKLGKLILTK